MYKKTTDSKRLKMMPVPTPMPGDIATHKSGTLDSRQVTKIDLAGVYLSIGRGEEFGPFPVENYTYKRREWV
jgi:hypothetical protein